MDAPESTASMIARSPGAFVPGACIRVVAGDDEGKTFDLASGQVVVGTRPDCGLQLSDSTVSGRHVSIAVQDDGLLVTDLDSKNGTFYLETRLERAVLQHGATVAIGRTKLMLGARAAALPPEYRERQAYGALAGSSPVMQKLYAELERLENIEFTTLLVGETGAGKELVAREIHAHSKRRKAAYEVCDCAALSKTLIESELFGHVRGAFTGAQSAHVGVFARANGGTVFLDEIGELPLELQPKLLRVLEEKQIRPVGGTHSQDVDVRVIAATNRNLAEEVKAGRFREDLYFRLNVVTLELPPLRQRRQDIPELVRSLLEHLGQPELALSPATMELFTTGYDWPGNVRELRNALSRVLALGTLPKNMEGSAPEAPASLAVNVNAPYHEEKKRVLDAFERDYLAGRLTAAQNNISRAAREAGVERTHFKNLLRKHGLRGRE
jgi:DNA-binding NtrC family response regulator